MPEPTPTPLPLGGPWGEPDERALLSTGQVFARSSPDRKEYTVRLIKAGKVRAKGNRESNVVLPTEPLIAAVNAGMFEAKACFVDHSGFFSYPSLRNLVGVTSSVEWNDESQSVDAVIKLYEGETAANLAALLDSMIADKQNGQAAPDVGISLVFWPTWSPRDNADDALRLSGIKHIESCDFVFEPGADGRIKQLLSSLASPGGEEPNQSANISLSGETPMPDQTVTPQTPTQEEPKEWLDAFKNATAHALISGSTLPQASKAKLASGYYTKPEEVTAAIEAEQAYLAQLQQDNVIQIGGIAPRSPHISMGLTGLEQVEVALEALMAGVAPPKGVAPLSGIREAYMLLSGDYELSGLFHGDRVMLQNVNCATMPGLVANALNKRIANLFQEYPRWWEKIVTIEDFTTMNQIRWITLGGVGVLPTVAEGAPYIELNWADLTETATFIKKGGFLGITMEAVDRDDTRKLQTAPRALAQAAWLALSRDISAIFTANAGIGPVMSDANNLFHALHFNVGAAALSFANFNAGRLAMRKHVELGSTERLGALTQGKYLLVPPDLETMALTVIGSDQVPAVANNDINPNAQGDSREVRLAKARERVIVVDLWTDTNDWAIVADPQLYPTIGLGFRYGRTPEIFSVASPTAGLMFTNDTMPIKARFIYATGPMTWNGLWKANVAGG